MKTVTLTLDKAQAEEVWRLVDTLARWSHINGSAYARMDDRDLEQSQRVIADTRKALAKLGIKAPA